MNLSLLIFLAISHCSFNLFAQADRVIDTAKIKPAKIAEFDHIWSPTYGSKETLFDYVKGLYKEQEYSKELYADVQVKITNLSKNTPYRLYIKNLATGKYILTSDSWIYNNCDSSASITIDRKLFKSPLKYEVSVMPMAKLDGKNFFPINKKVTYKSLFGKPVGYFKIQEKYRVQSNYLWLSAYCICLVLAISAAIRARSINAIKQKEKAQLQLDAVRSQLNPHFLFNALAGIQTLMNTNQTEQANRYLTRFSRLTRAVLKSTDLISLDEERNLLDDYLQMEQLRFNFNYEIAMDPNLDVHNIEIPSMLLQPFIENSVKHGIASLNSNGQINIAIFKSNENLILQIEDNGKGFDTTKTYEGLGFDLSTKRVALLNKVYKKDPILLSMQSQPGKTIISITLTKWL